MSLKLYLRSRLPSFEFVSALGNFFISHGGSSSNDVLLWLEPFRWSHTGRLDLF